MDKANENRNSMFKALDLFFIEKAGKIQGVPALVRKAAALHNFCTDVGIRHRQDTGEEATEPEPQISK